MAEAAEETSANDELVAAALLFALLADRYALTLQAQASARLARLRSDLAGLIARIDPTAPTRVSDRANRLTKVLEESNVLIKASYADLYRILRDGLRTLAPIAEDAAAKQAERAAGVPVFTRRSEPAEQRSLVDGVLIMGATLKLWMERHAGNLSFRLATALRDLALRERPLEEMLDTARGTDAAKGADGVVGISTRQLAVLVAAAVHAVSNAARDALYRRHPESVGALLHYSVIDDRTCLVAGTLVDTPKGPIPIEDIKPGSFVIGGSGDQRIVTGTKKSLARRLVRVTLDNGQTIVCTPDHLFLVESPFGQEWVEASALLRDEEISRLCGKVNAGSGEGDQILARNRVRKVSGQKV